LYLLRNLKKMQALVLKYKKLLLVLFSIISFISLFETISKSLKNGMDFQWHPSKLFWEGINHYRYFLDGGKMFMAQGGQYGHALQIILYPFALLEWPEAKALWVIINVILSFLIPFIICKSFKVTPQKIWFIILIFVNCYPTRMTINYGQQSLFILFFLILPFLYTNRYSYFLSGLSYVKYSTGYIIFFYYFIEKKFKYLALATLPCFIGWCIYFKFTNSDPLLNFIEPFQWIFAHNYQRTADLYSLLNIYFLKTNNLSNKLFIIFIVLSLNLFFLFRIRKIEDKLIKMSLIFLLPLIFMPHSNYDYVLLLPLLILGVSNLNLNINKFNFYFVVYYFYLNRVIKHLIHKDIYFDFFTFIFFLSVLIININYYRKNNSINNL